jgi:hypothetical protein
MNTQMQKMIHDYVEAWNEHNEEDFTKAFTNVWTQDSTYTDPTVENLTGIDAIVKLAINSLDKFPGRKFEVSTEPETHHNVGRYNWKVTFADGKFVIGFDYFEFDNDFKLTKIVSFF